MQSRPWRLYDSEPCCGNRLHRYGSIKQVNLWKWNLEVISSKLYVDMLSSVHFYKVLYATLLFRVLKTNWFCISSKWWYGNAFIVLFLLFGVVVGHSRPSGNILRESRGSGSLKWVWLQEQIMYMIYLHFILLSFTLSFSVNYFSRFFFSLSLSLSLSLFLSLSLSALWRVHS